MKCGMKLPILPQTSTVAPLKFGNVYVSSSYALRGMWLIIQAGIKFESLNSLRPSDAYMRR